MSTERTQLVARITDALARTSQRADAINNAAAARLGINDTDLRCIQLLAEHGPLTAGELARMTGLTTASITGLVDRLERAGLAHRTHDPSDRRRVVVELQRNAVMAQVMPLFTPVTRAWRKALDDYDEHTLAAIAAFLEQAADVLETEAHRLRGVGEGRRSSRHTAHDAPPAPPPRPRRSVRQPPQ